MPFKIVYLRIQVRGDGRCDSHVFDVKYCTYSLMNINKNKIIVFHLVSVGETGSSSRIEKGFVKVLEKVGSITTDQHTHTHTHK